MSVYLCKCPSHFSRHGSSNPILCGPRQNQSKRTFCVNRHFVHGNSDSLHCLKRLSIQGLSSSRATSFGSVRVCTVSHHLRTGLGLAAYSQKDPMADAQACQRLNPGVPLVKLSAALFLSILFATCLSARLVAIPRDVSE